MPSDHPQDVAYARSQADPESFWLEQASHLDWAKQPTRALARGRAYDPTSFCLYPADHPHCGSSHAAGAGKDTKRWPWSWSWFPDGEINTCENMLDRHVRAGFGHTRALIWDSPVDGGAQQTYTYSQLLLEVETFAAVLRDEGNVRKGDVVLLYMPMIPAAVIAMLATIRLGAMHAVVFGGFAPAALAQRIDSARPKVILTASCAIEGSKGPVPYQPLVKTALSLSKFKPDRTIVWQRDNLRWDPVIKNEGERNWQRLVTSAKKRGIKADPVPVKSTDGLYIIYTSGTTGSPKGVVREAGGHAVGLHLSARHLFGLRGPGSGDVMFCASDVGWVVGHSYIFYAPLLAGVATVLFEGKPVGTPDASVFWRIIAEHRVSILSTAPTALRAISQADPDSALLARHGAAGGLKTLRAVFLAGERADKTLVERTQAWLLKYGATDARVVDTWWTSETGSPITGIALGPELAFTPTAGKELAPLRPLPIKPGSAGKPLPGFDVRVLDDEGREMPAGEPGNLVLAMPLAPTGLTTLWRDPDRFYASYVGRFRGPQKGRGKGEDEFGDASSESHYWIDTGDAGIIDKDGYVHVLSRTDDIINVAAHRLGSGALEQAISGSDGRIGECCVVPIPDALKGHLPFAVVTVKGSSGEGGGERDKRDGEILANAQKAVRSQIGPIATLGGMIVLDQAADAGGKSRPTGLPKTRSGKTLRRLVRQVVELASDRSESASAPDQVRAKVEMPSAIEDADVVDTLVDQVVDYFGRARVPGGKREVVGVRSKL